MATKDSEETIRFWDRYEVKAASDAYERWLAQPTQSGTPANEILTALEFCRPSEAIEASTVQNLHRDQSRLLAFAAEHLELFQMSSPFAPKFRFVGAISFGLSMPWSNGLEEASSFSGAGITLQLAFQRCIGEAVEFYSQFARPKSDIIKGSLDDCFNGLPHINQLTLREWCKIGELPEDCLTEIVDCSTGQSILFPAPLIFRGLGQSDNQFARFALSTGTSAAASTQDALRNSLLEAIERDAAALWWEGGLTGQVLHPEWLENMGVSAHLRQMRAGNTTRMTTLCDITTELGIPCVAAFSHNRDGGWFAVGISCRDTLRRACLSATNELFQMELGLLLLESKQQQLGKKNLSTAERKRLSRCVEMNCLKEPLFTSASQISVPRAESDETENLAFDFHILLNAMNDQGFRVLAKDMSREEYGIAACRVLVPGLQPYPSKFESPRLINLSNGGLRDLPSSRGYELY